MNNKEYIKYFVTGVSIGCMGVAFIIGGPGRVILFYSGLLIYVLNRIINLN